ncbi:MAG: hypothetical protein ACE5FT_02230 [Candidatus Nanoarchaeia archaeon]
MRKIALILVLLLASCIIKPPVEVIEYHDLTHEDILKLIDEGQITGAQVSVNGVHLGDPLPKVLKAFGPPHYIDEYQELGIVNVRYDNKEINKTALIFNVVNDSIQRITVKAGFAPHLINSSKMNYHLHNITSTFGKPDKMYDSQFIRVYEYHPEGLEIFHRRKRMRGFAFVYPK